MKELAKTAVALEGKGKNSKESKTVLSIIIPCYNEEEGIPNLKLQLTPVLESLATQYSIELIFIDDGSKDRTNILLHENFTAEKLPTVKVIQIIKHEVNKNLGAGMRTGYAAATGEIIATLDSDCTYKPSLLPEMLKLLDADTDIVVASPYHPKGKVENIPEYRLFLSRTISWMYRVLTKSKIHTFTALFRVQRRKVIDIISFESNNFLATAESLIYAMFAGFKVKEFPTTLSVRQYGVSKMRLLMVVKSHAKFVWKLFVMRLRGKTPKAEK